MDLTYHILLEELGLSVRDFSCGRDPGIRSVELFDPKKEDPGSDVLYIATLHDAAAVSSSRQLNFICANGGGSPASIITENNIAVVEERISLSALANRVYAVFTRLSGWIIRMQRSVIDQEGVQALLDISDSVLRTTITVMDSTYKLLAYSHGWLADDPVNSYLIENGFHSDETMERLRKYDRFRESENSDDLIISHDRSISDYVTVKKFFKHFNLVSVYVVMVCNHRELSPGLTALFRILNSFIEFYAKKGYPYDGKYSAFDTLLHDMLDKNLSNCSEIEQRAERAELPFNGLFDLYKVQMVETARQSVAYLALKLSGMLPDTRISFYQNAIIILNTYRHGDEVGSKFEFCRRTLAATAGDSIHAVGISNVFTRLDGFTLAYRQADAVLRLADILPPSGGEGVNMLLFEDCYICHMLLSLADNEGALYSNCTAAELVRKLAEYSRLRSYDYVELLLIYLLAERRSTDVGEQLHLHRNTVIYHVGKIEELLNVSLEDPALRQKLIVEILRHRLTSPRLKPPAAGG